MTLTKDAARIHRPEQADIDTLFGKVPPRITLDGLPARITGRLEPYATVSQQDGKVSAQWAWASVLRIIAKGGAFKS